METYHCPTVICLPTVCYFSREKPLVKPTAPGSLSHIICLLFSDLLNQKYKITLLQFILIYFIWRLIYQSTTIYSRPFANFWRRYPKGIDNPFYTSGCEYLLFVCRWCLRCVAWFSYWFDNLGIITEGNTYCRCAASSLPLWGNTDVASSRIKPLVKPMAPGSTFHHISFRSTIFQSFTFQSITKQPKSIYFIFCLAISLLQVIMKGLTTPLSRWVQVVWLLCMYRLFVRCVLLDWYLVL